MRSATAQEVAPNFNLTDIDGVKFSLNDQRGKVVLLDFFAILCSPCVTEMQHLNVLHQEFGENIIIVSISITPEVDSVEKLQQFRQANNMSWIVARDTEGMSNNYSVQIVPTLVIIDQQGYIRHRHVDLTDESVLQPEISVLIPEFGTAISLVFVFLIPAAIVVIFKRKSRLNLSAKAEHVAC